LTRFYLSDVFWWRGLPLAATGQPAKSRQTGAVVLISSLITHAMHFLPHELYHVYNRGNNRETVFFEANHYLYFLRKLRQHVLPHGQLLAYCLMPNHFHLLIAPGESVAEQHPLRQAIGTVLGSYTQGINREKNRTGAIFQARTKAVALTSFENYPLACFHYIHQNPVRAGIVVRREDWPYSSYRDYAGLRNGTLCDQLNAQQVLDLPPDAATFRQESARMIPPDRMSVWL
jgi:putative transposase